MSFNIGLDSMSKYMFYRILRLHRLELLQKEYCHELSQREGIRSIGNFTERNPKLEKKERSLDELTIYASRQSCTSSNRSASIPSPERSVTLCSCPKPCP